MDILRFVLVLILAPVARRWREHIKTFCIGMSGHDGGVVEVRQSDFGWAIEVVRQIGDERVGP